MAVELLPEVRRVHDPFEVGWTFAAGVALMLGIEEAVKRLGPAAAHGAARGPAPGRLVPIAVDLRLDGLLIGIALTAGLEQGVLLTVALTLERFSFGLAMALAFGAAAISVRIRAPTAASCLMIVGAVLGRVFLVDTELRRLKCAHALTAAPIPPESGMHPHMVPAVAPARPQDRRLESGADPGPCRRAGPAGRCDQRTRRSHWL